MVKTEINIVIHYVARIFLRGVLCFMFDRLLLSEKVANNITKLITDQEINSGDKLPNEIELAKQLSVSRSTVREAIKLLVSRNILEIRRGRGTYVCERPGIATDPLGVIFMNKKDILLYLFETRMIIEPGIAEIAAIKSSKKNIKDLEEAFNKIEKKVREGKNHTDADLDFHNIIAKSTQNPILHRILPIINDSIKEGYLETKDIPESGEKVITDHRNILHAIKQRDSESAKRFMKEHIVNGIEQISKKK